MSPAAPVGIAIFGAGLFARQAHLPAIKALTSGSAVLRAVFSRSSKSAGGLAAFAQTELGYEHAVDVYSEEQGTEKGLDAILAREDIQIVIVVMPIPGQPEAILKALAAGKHVLSEKPVGPTIAAAQELIATYREKYEKSGLHWRVAENFEVEPTYLWVRDAIKAGKIGDVSSFRLTGVNYVDEKTNQYALTTWRAVPAYQGGFLLDGGVHSVALLRTILPTKMVSLSAFASLARPALPPHDTINAVVSLAPSSPNAPLAHGIFELSFGAPSESRSKLGHGSGVIVTGTTGWLSITNYNKDNTTFLKAELYTGSASEPEVFEARGQGVEREVENFVKLVTGEGDSGFGIPENALSDVSFIESALNSNGKPVALL